MHDVAGLGAVLSLYSLAGGSSRVSSVCFKTKPYADFFVGPDMSLAVQHCKVHLPLPCTPYPDGIAPHCASLLVSLAGGSQQMGCKWFASACSGPKVRPALYAICVVRHNECALGSLSMDTILAFSTGLMPPAWEVRPAICIKGSSKRFEEPYSGSQKSKDATTAATKTPCLTSSMCQAELKQVTCNYGVR